MSSCVTWARCGWSSGSARCCSARCSCSSSEDVQTGLVWLTKIITDPFHDVKLYYRAPLYLLRGELIDPMRPCRQPSAEAFPGARGV